MTKTENPTENLRQTSWLKQLTKKINHQSHIRDSKVPLRTSRIRKRRKTFQTKKNSNNTKWCTQSKNSKETPNSWSQRHHSEDLSEKLQERSQKKNSIGNQLRWKLCNTQLRTLWRTFSPILMHVLSMQKGSHWWVRIWHWREEYEETETLRTGEVKGGSIWLIWNNFMRKYNFGKIQISFGWWEANWVSNWWYLGNWLELIIKRYKKR